MVLILWQKQMFKGKKITMIDSEVNICYKNKGTEVVATAISLLTIKNSVTDPNPELIN